MADRLHWGLLVSLFIVFLVLLSFYLTGNKMDKDSQEYKENIKIIDELNVRKYDE